MKSLYKKNNNKGMSLVEVIISVAIVSIVLTVIFSFMLTGSRIFTSSTTEVKMQQDAQLVLNNIENRILDAQLGAYYEQDDPANPTFAKLTILNKTGREYIFWVGGTENKIYYDADTVDTSTQTGIDNIQEKTEGDLTTSSTKEILAENVNSFHVEFKETKVEETDVPKPKAYVAMNMESKDKNGTDRGIESMKTVSFRNNISTEVTDEKQLYIDSKSKVVSANEIKVSPENYTIVVPSAENAKNSKKFSARVTGFGNPSQMVEWEIEGGPIAGVEIVKETGELTVDKNATVPSVKVVAKSVVNPDKTGSAIVLLKKITGVTASCGKKAYAGNFITIDAVVSGEGLSEEEQEVTYSVTGGDANDLQLISELGTFYLKPAAQGKTYTIRVTSKYDTNVFCEYEVNVEDVSLTETGNGRADAVRGETVELVTCLEAVNLAENELTINWRITHDDGLAGKVKVNNRGEFTVQRDVNFEKSYDVEVMATITAGRLNTPLYKLITVHIPAVSIHFADETTGGKIQKNTTKTFKLEATGLALEPSDVNVTTNPSLRNCIVLPTKDGIQVSVGGGNKATKFDLIATLKNTNTSTSMKVTIE